MSTVRLSQRPLRGWFGLAVLLLAVFLPMACAMPTTGQDDSMRQTDVSLGIQQTLLAQTAAALSSQGSKQGVTPAPATAVPAATDTPVPTATIAETATTAPTMAATDTATASFDVIDITKWKMISFTPLNSGCPISDAPCWKDNFSSGGDKSRWDINNRGAKVDYTLYLISLEPVLIDQSWPAPYLVFNYKLIYEAELGNLGVEIGYGTTTQLARSFHASSNTWKTEAIPLEIYKGKEIIVRIGGHGSKRKEFEWLVQQVQIIPNYTP